MEEQLRKPKIWGVVDRIYDKMAEIMVDVGAVALIVCMAVAFFDMLATKLFGSSIKYSVEIVTYLDVPIAYLGMGYTFLHGDMTCVDLVSEHFSLKVRKICEIIFDILGFATCVFMTKLAVDNTMDHFSRGVLSGVKDGFAIWPFVLLETIGWAFLALAFLFCLMRIVLKMVPVPGTEAAQLPAAENGESNTLPTERSEK